MPTRSGRDYSLMTPAKVFSKLLSPSSTNSNESNIASELSNNAVKDGTDQDTILKAVTFQMFQLFEKLEEKVMTTLSNATTSGGPLYSLNTHVAPRVMCEVGARAHHTVGPTTASCDVSPSPSNSPSSTSCSRSEINKKSLPPLGKLVELKYPTYNGDPDTFPNWKNHFLNIIASSELEPLIDNSSELGLVQFNDMVKDDILKKYNVRLYSRIIDALPSSSSFTETEEYRSNGLTLWHALVQENMSIGSNFNTNTLLPAWYSLNRMETETIDAYWNRFHTHLRKVQRDPTVQLLHEHIRLQFITTLGNGFTFLVEDVENNRLDS